VNAGDIEMKKEKEETEKMRRKIVVCFALVRGLFCGGGEVKGPLPAAFA
jgi:hypothetical protein